jgi:Raf kinase inhibitor-like YbhB/YbcL family protein
MVSSPALGFGGRIQKRFTCDGADISPPLQWSAPPPAAREVVVTMVDLDAPQPPFVHWALAGLAPGLHVLSAGSAPQASVPGANSFGSVGYRGPCPPRGDRPHRYQVEVWALGQTVSLRRGFLLGEVRPQLVASSVARGVLQGTYRR